ncbi:FMN-binding protein [Paenibacillus selenitireducens]|uniref:FMN-binding protein n=1 Tax=Paenibacillus selenitireducens TaxID=1324314 RepID=A0A1T2XAN5_9BACL|nr:FMN-binding protein [Paenibacillus selenitireducens]OPA76961.1 FMN-binding protein [Paenibacillus selenitireducens]
MKKLSVILMTTALVIGLLAGCGAKSDDKAATDNTTSTEQTTNDNDSAAKQGAYADGTYYAEQPEFAEGWKYAVTLKVEGGKITEANWNGINEAAGPDKKTLSKEGKYPMKEKGGALAEWHEEAQKAEQFLIEKQDPKAITTNADGKSDAVSGVTITVAPFAELAEKALAAGVVQPGPYKDGAYHAEEADFDKTGFKFSVDLTVLNGNIVAANWDGLSKDGGDTKKKLSQDGKYGMKEKGNALAEWHEEAAAAEKFLIEKQDPSAFALKDDGKSDAVSGVTITVSPFVDLATKALEGAK